ncbi:hypothetical protein [Nocardia yamanashiensis]|uniref:hypothetical protein n=1 Tax=Nocardia yamanashiensis TaxID=209247 RepID=UPI000A3FADE3|nr:hypothetical protein [Nocardia yamanashiensis]
MNAPAVVRLLAVLDAEDRWAARLLWRYGATHVQPVHTLSRPLVAWTERTEIR